VYPVHGTIDVFIFPDQITRNSKAGYGHIWTGHHKQNSERISEIADFSLFGVSAPFWGAEIVPNHKQNYGGFFNMNVRNEIKAQIIRAGMTMGSIGACRCAGMRHCMAAKTGEVMPPATAPRISRPHRHTAVLPMDGSERRCQRLQETFRRTASCRRADHGKSSAEVTAVTAHPLGRAHGTLQPEWMKVL